MYLPSFDGLRERRSPVSVVKVVLENLKDAPVNRSLSSERQLRAVEVGRARCANTSGQR